MSAHTGPLSGYRIVDLTSFMSGPYATMLLADQGAEVIKVEQPGVGDLMRHGGTSRNNVSAFFVNCNRNKRSVTLDLSRADAIEALCRLTETSDVFVQNFRPGTADRLGIGERALRARNSELVYVSISGFGATGPYASRRTYDTVIQAISGIAYIQNPSGEAPELVRTYLPDKLTAQTTAQGITAALLARERGSGGQHVEISMLDAAVAWMWPDAMTDLTFVDDTDVVRTGDVAGMELIFRTHDGYIMVVSNGPSDAEFAALARGLDKPQLVEDGRFSSLQDRLRHANVLADILREELVKHPTAYWHDRFAEEDAVSAPVNRPEDVIGDPQVLASETVLEYQHSAAGRIRQPRHPVRFSATPANPAGSEAPVLGEHTYSTLREVGLPDDEIKLVTGEG